MFSVFCLRKRVFFAAEIQPPASSARERFADFFVGFSHESEEKRVLFEERI
jgi:hypothetical protein